MKPVDQTTFGMPGGNCFSASVASILELPIEDVPYFMGDGDDEDGEWWERFKGWLRKYKLYPLMFKGGDYRPPGYHLLSGPADRGFDHTVVAKGSSIVHDPHPSRSGLLSQSDYIVMVQFDPSRRKESD